jgi:hypothetical protein
MVGESRPAVSAAATSIGKEIYWKSIADKIHHLFCRRPGRNPKQSGHE